MKDNKIISLDNYKKRNCKTNNQECKKKYSLKYKITITISQKNNDDYTCYYTYPEEITEDEFFKIIYEIYLKIGRSSKRITVTEKQLLNKGFALLYYTNDNNPKDFKFICTPKIDETLLGAILKIIIDGS